MSRESLAHIALHDDARDIVSDAVATARRLTRRDAAYAAERSGGCFRMTARSGLREPGWSHVAVRTSRGLGGLVIAQRAPRVTSDYFDDPMITSDYHPIVRAEGLRAVLGVPLVGPDGIAGVLYVGDRDVGECGDRLVDALVPIADMVRVGLTVAARAAATGGAAGATALSAPPTPRELEVLRLLDGGASNREIARVLVIAESTAKGHVAALREKLGATSRLDAVARARAAGLLGR